MYILDVRHVLHDVHHVHVHVHPVAHGILLVARLVECLDALEGPASESHKA